MKVTMSRSLARFYVPKGQRRIARNECKYLIIGAHPDDIEILGHYYAHRERQNGNRRFFGVVVANGASKKPRLPEHEKFSMRQMTNIRYDEQQKAADIGEYGGIWMMAYPSPSICRKVNHKLVQELREIILATQPQTLITHNPLDAHPTHVSVLYHVYLAIQSLPPEKRPKYLKSGEGWGDISRWYVLLGDDKAAGMQMINCSRSLNFLHDVLVPFASQNGIMSYDDAVPAMLRVRAKLMNPHRKTGCKGVQVFFNMRPVLKSKMTLEQYRDHLLDLHRQALSKNYSGYKDNTRRPIAAMKKVRRK